ncbi:hypothetical protein NG798_17175 [Ancylothrix sp. C2]|uniref:hypothetical protein n=1 Tax=Ancylothrix sp. D3o TaxID=2953691 RepID=UPI0021BB4D2D|nr:hypothetical protein [Ancylothrix sp. D3o]MCT7951538.1 hypothetical protein [Ancylothrix sp. D3o]
MIDSTSPYKSRIFNFLNQQTHRLAEKCQQAARHFKIAAEWGIQAVVYSLQAIVESVQQAGKQLPTTPQPENAKLPETKISQNDEPLAADNPIQKVIEAAREIPLNEDFVKKTLFSVTKQAGVSQNPIQAVASLRERKTLVLISADNEILDILNHSQQQKLRQKILAETAYYARHRRQNEIQKLPENSPKPTQTQQLAPASPLNEIQTWVKTGPIGVAFNIIQDAAIIANPKNILEETQNSKSEINPYETIKQNLLPPAKAAIENSIQAIQNFNLPSPESLQTSLSQTSQSILNQIKQIAVDLVTDPLPNPETTAETESPKIQTFLQTTVDYFLGENREKLFQTGQEDLTKLAKLDKKESQNLAGSQPLTQPWLSFQDLFGKTPTLATTNSTQIPLTEKPSLIYPKPEKIEFGETLQKINQTTRKKTTAKKPKATTALKTTKKPTTKTETSQTIETKKTTKVEHTPDWIDIKATSIGYVKHPLESLLEWVDKALLFLEEVILAVLQWIKKSR